MKKKLWRGTRAGALVGALLLAATACTGPQTTGTGGQGGEGGGGSAVNVFLYQKPKGVFSPMAPASGPDFYVQSMVFMPLMQPGPDLQLAPRAAKSMEASEDAKTFTFKLRDDLKWTDGTPFTAKDVVMTFNLLADAKTGTASSGNFATVEGFDEFKAGTADKVSGFQAPDDHTFVMKSKTANMGLPALVVPTAMILPEHILGSKKPEEMANEPFFKKPDVGLGPYSVTEYKTDQYVNLKKNPNFPGGVGVDEVFLKPVTNDVAVAQLGTGEMDLASVPASELATVKGMDKVKLSTAKDGGFTRMAVNQERETLKNPKVRQGLMYGMDREAMVKSIFPEGNARVRNSAFDPTITGDGIEQYKHDPEKAKQLLTEGGWDFSKELEVQWIAGGNPDRDAAATIFQAQMAEIGVKVKLTHIEAAQQTDSLTNGNYDLMLMGGGNYATNSWSVAPIIGCDTFYPKGANLGHYCNPELDAKLKEANTIADESERNAKYAEAAKIENAEVSYLWLYNFDTNWAQNTKLDGITPLALGSGFYNPEEWKLSK